MNKVKISVVMPCYNVEKYIRRGLDSVLMQSLQDWEAILVDNGATDSTGEICEEYAHKDKRFKVIHTENQGVSCARNTGIQYATGEQLYFMDPDDWIEPNCFQRCYETYKRYDCDIVHFGFWWVYGIEEIANKSGTFKVYRGNEIHNEYTKQHAGFGQEALNQYYGNNFIWDYKKGGFIWAFMFRKSFIQKHNLTFPVDMKLAEDEIFMTEATYKAASIVRIPDVLYHYFQRPDSAVNRKKDADFLFEHKFRQLKERRRLREMIKEFDLHESYFGSHVFSCLKVAVDTSNEWKNYNSYREYVTHPDIQESIKEVSLKGAPLKFAAPVYLLKIHCQLILFAGCWLLHKIGLANKIKM